MQQELVLFSKHGPFQPLYECDEELEEQLKNPEDQDGHQSNRDAVFTDFIVSDEEDDGIQREHKRINFLIDKMNAQFRILL